MKKSLKYIIMAIFLILFIIMIINVRNNPIFEIDKLVSEFMTNIRTNSLTTIIKILTNLGSGVFLIVLSVLLVIILKNKKVSFAICLNLLSGFLLNFGLKTLVARARPINPLIEVTGYSFPSGHTTTSFVFYGFLIYLIFNSNITKKFKTILIGISTLTIIVIMFSRVYLGAHFISDVIGSILLSVPYLIAFTSILKFYFLRNQYEKSI